MNDKTTFKIVPVVVSDADRKKMLIPETPTIEQLKIARALIEKGWSQGSYAKDSNGDFISLFSPKADRWCLMGSAYYAGISPYYIQKMFEKVFNTSMIWASAWNDMPERTKEDILTFYDDLIKHAIKNHSN